MRDGGQQGFSQIQILILILDMSKKKFIRVLNLLAMNHVLQERIIPMAFEVMNFKNKNTK